jgi:hypothetical protein
MATMSLPMNKPFREAEFEAVEDNMEQVKYGVKMVNRAGIVIRVLWKVTVLQASFNEAISTQGTLIDRINGPATQNMPADALAAMAAHIEHLVSLNDELLEVAAPRYREYQPWMKMLAELRFQRDTLESIAESFRSASDPEHQALMIAALETMYT